MSLASCTWCGRAFDQRSPSTDIECVCSEQCRQAKRTRSSDTFHKATGGLFNGGFVNTVQNQVQIAQLQRQNELTAQQNALIAEQNKRLAEQEAKRQQQIAKDLREEQIRHELVEWQYRLNQCSRFDDKVAQLLVVDCFWEFLKSNDIAESSLSLIDDKRFLRTVKEQAAAVHEVISPEFRNRYETFKLNYEEFQRIRKKGANVATRFPMKSPPKFKFDKAKVPRSKAHEQLDDAERQLKERSGQGYVAMGCGCTMGLVALLVFVAATGVFFTKVQPNDEATAKGWRAAIG